MPKPFKTHHFTPNIHTKRPPAGLFFIRRKISVMKKIGDVFFGIFFEGSAKKSWIFCQLFYRSEFFCFLINIKGSGRFLRVTSLRKVLRTKFLRFEFSWQKYIKKTESENFNIIRYRSASYFGVIGFGLGRDRGKKDRGKKERLISEKTGLKICISNNCNVLE